MASISILEKDLTTASNSSTTANVVYVPGYAIMGPVNEPTLCSSLAQFEQIFGSTPYKFKETQKIEDGLENYAQINEYEKSYLYAAELLKMGLPVLFERVATLTTYAQSKLVLKEQCYHARYIQKDVSLTLKDQEGVEDGSGKYLFEYIFNKNYLPKVNIDEAGLITINDLVIEVFDEHNNRLSETIESEIEAQDDTFVLSFTASIQKVNIRLNYNLDTLINYNFFGIYNKENNSKDLTWLMYQNETNIIDADIQISKENNNYFIDYTNDYISIENLLANIVDKEIEILDGNTSTKLNITLPASNNSEITLLAKYPGSYGANIKYSLTSEYKASRNETYYNFIVSLTTDNSEKVEAITVCLTPSDDKYIKKVSSDLIKFENIKINEILYNFGLYKLEDITTTSLTYDEDSTKDEFTISEFYNRLSGYTTTDNKKIDSIFVKLEDKDEYDLKFITSGSYPVVGLTNNSILNTMLTTAANRGDAIALIDHIDTDSSIYNNILSTLSVKTVSGVTGEDANKYAAMFTPWGKYQLQTLNEITEFPGSFGYLKCLAASSKTNPNWYAVSGVIRGQVPNLLELNQKISGALANQLQLRRGISINPITNIKPYGYCIWGNRTLYDNIDDLTASSFLNIRMISNDVKKVVYKAAKKLTFELNSDVLWLNFKAAIEPTLEQMKSGNGLSNYKIIKVPTTKKATIACKIRLYAIEAVEDWDITVELADSYTTIQ